MNKHKQDCFAYDSKNEICMVLPETHCADCNFYQNKNKPSNKSKASLPSRSSTNTTAEKYLLQINTLGLKLQNIERQVMYLKDTLGGSSSNISDMPASSTPNIRRMEDLIVKKMDLENEMETIFHKLHEIIDMVNSLSNERHKAILTNRYFYGLKWEAIAKEMNLSIAQTYRLRREALLEIEKLIADDSF